MWNLIRRFFQHFFKLIIGSRFKFLFIAEFTDGSIIKQNHDDKSSTGGANCYSDVLQAINQGKKLHTFSLIGRRSKLSVDLLTGLFTINGITIISESDRLPTPPSEFKLVWYNQVSQFANATYTANGKGNADLTKVEPAGEFREFFIGWTAIVKDREYTQKIAVN